MRKVFQTLIPAVLLCLGLSIEMARAQQPGSAEITVIIGGTLIDGTGRPPRKEAEILIEGKRIKSIGEVGKTAYPPDARVIKATGKFILPGLFDSHVHYRDWVGELFLAHGVTSVIDMGNPIDWVLAQRDAIAKGKMAGPRIFVSGDALHQRFGSPSSPLSEKDIEAVRRAVRETIAKGVDKIAAMIQQDPRTFSIIAEEAHKAGIPVSAYTTYPREEVAAGLDAIEHSYSLASGSKKDPTILRLIREQSQATDVPRYLKNPLNYSMDPDADDFIQLLVEKGTYVIPSLIFEYKLFNGHRAEFEQQNLSLLMNPNLRYVKFEDFVPQLTSYSHFGIPRLGGPGYFGTLNFEGEESKQYQKSFRNLQAFLKQFSQRGGKILAGSDAPNMDLPGISLHQELQLLVELGMTPMQVIQAATRLPATFIRKDKDLGTVEPGKLADIIVLDADPLQDIKNIRRINTVMKEGRVLDTTYHADFVNPIPRPSTVEMQRNPEPHITDIFPKAATEGDETVTLTVRGSDFIFESAVVFDGERVATKFSRDTELIATIPSRLLKRVGTVPVAVWNPLPAGGISGDIKFIVKFK